MKFHWIQIFYVFLVFSLFISSGIFYLHFAYAEKIAPGVSVQGIPIGGLTQEELSLLFYNNIEKYIRDGISFEFQGKKITIASILEDSSNIELSRPLLTLDSLALQNEIFLYGRRNNFWKDINERLDSFFFKKNFSVHYTIDKIAFEEILHKNFLDDEFPAIDAKLEYNAIAKKFQITSEKNGEKLNIDEALETFKKNISLFRYSPITIHLMHDSPKITKKDFEFVFSDIEFFMDTLPVFITYQDKKWEIDRDVFGTWLSVTRGDFENGNQTQLTIDREKFEKFFDVIKKEVEEEPQNAKFEIENEKVKEFQPSKKGKKIHIEDLFFAFLDDIKHKSLKDRELVFKEVDSDITNEKVNTFGIKEILGIGHSNFAGSPKNRRHNISVGAVAVHGTLIAPKEEFSLIKTLGNIDAKSGYLPELVIKGGRTIPEYGGGLCQIGTTTFRATMGSGLPITERQNHSYNVPYYLEDGLPGTDATIYIPHPDFRFINDTGNYILIQTRIEKDDLYFEFWGTKDQRIASRTKPEVWDKITPPPTRIIETTDLPVGEKKCTEKSHTGLKAKFTYTVIYPTGEKKEKEFFSTYRPWQAVCLVGVEKKEEEISENSEKEISSEVSSDALPSISN